MFLSALVHSCFQYLRYSVVETRGFLLMMVKWTLRILLC